MTASVSLAGTSLSSPIYGSVVFNLTFFNEVTLPSRAHQGGRAQQHRAARTTRPSSNIASSCHHRQPQAIEQLSSLKAHDVRIRETLRSLSWPEGHIHTLMSPSSLPSSSAAPGGNASTSSSHLPPPPSLDAGYTDPMYASSHGGGVGDTPIINRGVTGNTTMKPFTSSKPGEGLHAFVGDSAVSTARPAGDALAVVAGAVLDTKPVRLEGDTLTSKQVHAFCDHIDQLVWAHSTRRLSRC